MLYIWSTQNQIQFQRKCVTKTSTLNVCILEQKFPLSKKKSSPGSMHDTGCLGLVHWDNPKGWYGEGGAFRMGNTCIPVADSF